jgi:hypothetical protein
MKLWPAGVRPFLARRGLSLLVSLTEGPSFHIPSIRLFRAMEQMQQLHILCSGGRVWGLGRMKGPMRTNIIHTLFAVTVEILVYIEQVAME